MIKTNIKNILKCPDENTEFIFNCLSLRPKLWTDKNGYPVLTLFLSDQNSEIPGKKWNITNFDKANLTHGIALQIKGKLSFFKNSKQIIINEWKILKDEETKKQLLPQSPFDINEMWKEFKKFIEKITDSDYSKLIKEIFKSELKGSFLTTQAGLSVHHNVLGGLLWHSLTMLKMAAQTIKIYNYAKINKSLLFAGIMLHDIGKIVEIKGILPEKYTLKGTLLGHIHIGANIAKKFGKKLKINSEKIDLLQHMILASHGKLENGSPIQPILIESFILSQLDDYDAKLNAIWKSLKQTAPHEFTNKVFALNNAIFYNLSTKENKENTS